MSAPSGTSAAPPRTSPRRTARRRLAALLGVAVVLGLTLAPLGGPGAGPAAAPGAWRCVACGAAGGADFAGNVLLFVPLGALLVWAGARAPAAAFGGALLSLAVELAQAAGVPGRSPALGDFLANSAGVAAGAALGAGRAWLAAPPRRRAGALAVLAGSAWLAALGAGAWLLGRDAATGPWPPRDRLLDHTPGFGYYHGRVRWATVDGWTRPARPTDGRTTGPAVIGAATGRDVAASAAVLGGDARGSLVPIVFVHDALGRAQLLVGQRGADAVLRVRLRAARWRLRAPELVLAGALAANRAELAPVEARLDAARRGDTLRLRVAALGTERGAAERLTPATAWQLLPAPRGWGAERHLVTAAWLAATLAPFGYWFGYWAGRCWAGRWARGSALGTLARGAASAAAVIAAGLWALPTAIGAAAAPWWEWAGSAAGVALGAAGAAGAAAFARRPAADGDGRGPRTATASPERRVAARPGAGQLSRP